jgi:hypothetical protein
MLKVRKNCRKTTLRGQSLVEFCLSVPILLLLLTGSADFGYLMWTDMTIAEAVRSGAIFASSLATDTEDWNSEEKNPDIVKNYILNVARGTGLKKEEITISTVKIGDIDSVKIVVQHVHKYLAPISFVGLVATSGPESYTINRAFTCGFISNRSNPPDEE